MSSEDSLKSLSLDYLNLLINGQAFSDVAFSVEGRLVHAHRCVLAARSLFFRKLFCGLDPNHQPPPPPPPLNWPTAGGGGGGSGGGGRGGAGGGGGAPATPELVIPVSSIRYEVLVLVLQFLYSGQASVAAPKSGPLPGCGARGCWHTRCGAAVDLALDTLAAARSFGVEQLALLVQKQLESMVKEASVDDVMKVLMASRKFEMQELWATCSHLVARSGLSADLLAKHLPIDVVAKIEEIRAKSPLAAAAAPRSPFLTHHYLPMNPASSAADRDNKIRRMRRALDAADIELVKLMVMGEGLDLDDALAVHYAVQHCNRDVVKALLELGAADVNSRAWPDRQNRPAPGGGDGLPGHGVRAARPPRRPELQDARRRHAARRAPQPHLRVPLQGRRAGADAHRAQQAQALPRARAVGGDGDHARRRRACHRRRGRRKRRRQLPAERRRRQLGEPDDELDAHVPGPGNGGGRGRRRGEEKQ
uniref:Uncharacterized protein n=1 Tax=Oryza barthii TaxID=65489 RepID=A0A0D3HI21_9ORYZ